MKPHVPWRVKKWCADRFPRLYYLLVHSWRGTNSAGYWDKVLERAWDDPRYVWPTKNRMFSGYFKKDSTIVDIGFGTGTLLRSFLAQGFTGLWGYEHSDYALSRMAEMGVAVRKGSLPDLALPDSFFDGVIVSEVLEHLLRRRRFLREIARILKPAGRAVVSVPDNCMGPEEEPEHTIRYTAHTLRLLLEEYFHVEEIFSIQDENPKDQSLVAVVRKKCG